MNTLRVGVVGLALSLAHGAAGATQPAPVALAGGEQAHVSLVLRITPPGRSTFDGTSTDAFLAPGEQGEGAVGIGVLGPDGAVVSNRFGSADGTGSSESIREFAHRWISTYRVTSLTTRGAAIDLDLVRESGPPGGPERARHERHETLSLEWGRPAVLDFVDFPSAATRGSTENAVVELVARPVEAAALRNAALAYDVWLDVPGDGSKPAERLALAAGQGEAAPFVFTPRRVPVARVAGKSLVAQVGIEGSITGRATVGGDIVLTVLVRRRSRFGQDVEGRLGWAGSDEGSRDVVVHDGETVRIELPPAVGSETLRPIPPGLAGPFAAGVSVEAGELRLDWSRLLAGREGALVVTARRLR